MPSAQSFSGLSRRGFLGLAAAAGASVPLLSACGGGSGSGLKQVDVKVPDKYKKRQNIVMWTSWTGTNGTTMDTLLQKFNDSQTDIYAQAQYQGGYFDAIPKVTAALRAKAVPDLVAFGDTGWQNFFVNGYIEDLTGYMDSGFEDTLQPTLAAMGYIQGKMYWVPFARSTPIMYYNKTLFAKAGLPDRGPKTWTELREWGPELAKIKVSNGETAKATTLQGQDDWEYQASVWEFGGEYSDGLDIKINTDGAVDAAEWFRKLIFEDKMAYLEASYGTAFNTGLIGTYMNSTGALAGTYESAKAAKFEFGCSPLPTQVTGGIPPGGAGISMLKPLPTDRAQAAWELIKYLSTAESSAFWSLSTGYLPVVKDAVNQTDYAAKVKADPNIRVAIDQLPKVRQDDAIRAWIPNASPMIYQALQDIYGNNKATQGVLDDLATKLTTAAQGVQDTYNKYFPK